MTGTAGETNLEQGTIRIVREKFAHALDRIISEPDLAERLEKQPVETLAELGIEFDDRELAKLAASRLAHSIATLPPVEESALPETFATVVTVVGVTVVVGVTTVTVADERVDAALDVQRAVNRFNEVTLRQRARCTLARRTRRK